MSENPRKQLGVYFHELQEKIAATHALVLTLKDSHLKREAEAFCEVMQDDLVTLGIFLETPE